MSATEPDLSETIARAVTAVDGVAGLHGGRYGQAGTYLPGRRVNGVRLNGPSTEVHVTLQMGVPALEAAARIRRAVAALAPGPVDVVIEDMICEDMIREDMIRGDMIRGDMIRGDMTVEDGV